jgi:CheY-like chemotaxis protein
MKPNMQRSPRPGSIHRALLVDDDKFMLVVVGDMLRDMGISAITTAAGGTDGLAALRRMAMPPEVILCDLNMPQGDGFQFMEELSASGFGGGVILMSGLDSRVLKSAALMARFHRLNILDTLSKPVDAAALGAALAKLS